MRFLLITTAFPPYNSLGALRIGKLARFLVDHDHEVKILAAKNLPLLQTLRVEIDPRQITYTPWLDINFLPTLAFGGKKKVASTGYSTGSSSLKRLGNLYRDIMHFPDDQVGWYPYAVAAGKRILREWKPDMIYASAMPFTSLMVGSALARWARVPWVGELRDLWADHAYYVYGSWRRKPEDWLERRTLRSAAGLVTVAEPLAEVLRKKYVKPVVVIPNGYDLKDYPASDDLSKPEPNRLRIAYTGAVYPNYDLKPFFTALRKLGWTRDQVQVDFYVRYIDNVMQAAEECGVGQLVEWRGLVPYYDSLKAQAEADILLAFLWNDTEEKGVVPAKLFEYLGAGRPVLASGPAAGMAGCMITERRAGFVSEDADAIAAQLRSWMEQKAREGSLPYLPPQARVGLSREERYAKLEQFLLSLPASHSY